MSTRRPQTRRMRRQLAVDTAIVRRPKCSSSRMSLADSHEAISPGHWRDAHQQHACAAQGCHDGQSRASHARASIYPSRRAHRREQWAPPRPQGNHREENERSRMGVLHSYSYT